MPELPEVETVTRLIRPRIQGRTIVGTEVHWPRTIGERTPRSFATRLRNARITRVWRRAKFIVFDLERDARPAGFLVGHLRMTGRMHVERRGWDPGPYARVALELDDDQSFHFIDVRKFGRLIWVDDLRVPFARLGPEPLDESFTPDQLHRALRSRRRMLKPLLLDQSFLAGLGNIYVDEALHASGLHPLARSDKVTRAAARDLHAAVRDTLAAAIEREGSSFDTFYRTPEGQPGSYQHQFRVYGRTGQPCGACGQPIQRIVVAQRGTHLCRRCQPRRRRRRVYSAAP
jgi:formamidopyrimidine-DNA glycosylase